MSLDHAHAFYQALNTNADLQQVYLQTCSEIPELPYLGEERETLRHWSEAKILRFAAERGYRFGLGDLYRVWFGREDYRSSLEQPLGWKMQAIAALNRQMREPIIPQPLEASAA